MSDKQAMPARQGDLVIERVKGPPKGAKQREDKVLIRSSVTGHSHEVQGEATIFQTEAGTFFVSVQARKKAVLVHEGDNDHGHKAVPLEPGTHRISRKMQYADTGMVPVQD